MKRSKNVLVLAVLCSILGGYSLVAQAAEGLPNYSMDEIVVTAERDNLSGNLTKSKANVGLLGKKDVMEIPFSTVTINNRAIKVFSSSGGTGVVNALTLDPAVRSSASSLYNDMSIRGFNISGHMMYINGIPGMLSQERIPYLWADNVTVVSGPNLGLSGSTLNESAGGTVNITPKVAMDDGNKDVKIAYRGGNSFEEAVDIGQRFGANKEWGVRVNANNIHGETSIDNEKLEQQNVFVNIDHKNNKSQTNLLMGYSHTNHKAGPWNFSFGKKVTSLPDAPDSSKNYKPDWAYNEYDNLLATLNHEQKLTEHMSAFINAGYHKENWYGYIDGSPSVTNNLGAYSIGLTNYPLVFTKIYLGAGVKGNFKLGSLENEYMLGVDKTWNAQDLSKDPTFGTKGTYTVNGNLYQNNSWPSPQLTHVVPTHNYDVRMIGWHAVDTIKALDDKLEFTMGIHGHKVNKVPVSGDSQESSAICPTFAVNYKLTPDISIYANHSESFGMGTFVSTTSGYANAGEILDPSKTKQNEIGVKFKTGEITNTLSLFKINQANTVDVYEGSKKYLRVDGRQDNNGFEWSFTGAAAPKVDVIGGVMYLDSKDDNGRRVNGAAYWSGVLGGIYKADEHWSVMARANYIGTSTINNGALEVPAYCKFDLGASYKTKFGRLPVSIDAMCYNVTGKDYWNAQSGKSSLNLGEPRTFTLSATFSF